MTNKAWILNTADLGFIDSLIQTIITTSPFSEPERKHLIDQLNKERKTRWGKIGKCYFPNCTNKAIQNSHSLSDKMMIDPISENRHVCGPAVNTFTGKYEIQKISANKASIFPGFCQYHESLFTFEKEGMMSNGKELQMQLFRTICRQLFFLKHERDNLSIYREIMGKKLLSIIDELLITAPPLKTPIDTVKGYIDSEFLGRLDLMIYQRNKDIDYVEDNWYKPNADGFGELLSGKYYDELVAYNGLLPVVLSGPVLFDNCPRDNEGTPDFEYVFYVNIFPNGGKTHVHMASLRKQKDKLEKLAEQFEKDSKVLRTYIPEWMVKQSEHWYVSPKYWDTLDKSIKEKIIQELAVK